MTYDEIDLLVDTDPLKLRDEAWRLTELLVEARDELARWGWGDFHYGDQPQDPRVATLVARIDAALAEESS